MGAFYGAEHRVKLVAHCADDCASTSAVAMRPVKFAGQVGVQASDALYAANKKGRRTSLPRHTFTRHVGSLEGYEARVCQESDGSSG